MSIIPMDEMGAYAVKNKPYEKRMNTGAELLLFDPTEEDHKGIISLDTTLSQKTQAILNLSVPKKKNPNRPPHGYPDYTTRPVDPNEPIDVTTKVGPVNTDREETAGGFPRFDTVVVVAMFVVLVIIFSS